MSNATIILSNGGSKDGRRRRSNPKSGKRKRKEHKLKGERGQYINQQRVQQLIEKPNQKRKEINMQTVITPILAFLLGASVMYNFKPGYNLTELANANKNGNVTIIPNATFINSSIGEMKEELLQCKANFTLIGKVQDKLGHCQGNLTEIQNKFTKLTDNYLILRQEMKEELGYCQDSFTEIQTKFADKYLLLRQEMKEELGHSKDDYLILRRDMQIVTGQQEIANSDSIGNIWLFLFGSALEGLIFIFVGKWWLSRQNTTQDRQEDNTYNGEILPRPSKLLKQVKQVPLDMLDRSVCVVSFYEETQELHKRLTESAIPADIPIKQFLMKEIETHVMSIPRSRFILVFVDYNERNIILENSGQDLGDKKLVTVQAAQKMGADVFVVYVRDRGSTNLPDKALYNKNLASFTRHPTLGKLTVKDRGLSVYETFTDHQKRHINGIIHNLIFGF